MGLEGVIHPALIPSPNLSIGVASAKLKCRDAYFPDDAALTVDLQLVVREIVANLNFEPEAYEENLADARALAAKLGVEISPSDIPAKQPRSRRRVWGPIVGADRAVTGLAINCDSAGIYHIADAARLIDALMPSLVS